MTFDTLEISNFDSKPITLYEFVLGDAGWYYCTGETDITVAGNVYKATAISDSGIVQSGDVSGDDFTVTMPFASEVADLYRFTPPSETLFLNVRKMNVGSSEAPIVWPGEVRSSKRVNRVAIELNCKMLTATLNRNGLRLAWGRGCPHALYDRNCKANPALFGVTVRAQGFSGSQITSTSLSVIPPGYLAGGYVEWVGVGNIKERRAIESNSGNVVRLMGTTDGLTLNAFITVFPGCDRVSSTCKNKFNNLSNYGGFPHLPTKSPFDGDPIF